MRADTNSNNNSAGLRPYQHKIESIVTRLQHHVTPRPEDTCIWLALVQAAEPARSSKLPDVTAENQTVGQAFAPSLHAVGNLMSYDKRVAIRDEEFLHREGLSPATSCRSPGALRKILDIVDGGDLTMEDVSAFKYGVNITERKPRSAAQVGYLYND